ncbi:MAG TPA: hypothetical protein VGV59_04655 [Pyrinomonadaceae bacterium]|nr:hypothetical protein [Pyrinomonadaceae bacterium]
MSRFLVPVLALCFVGFADARVSAQTPSSPFAFRTGQTVYIVAFRKAQPPVAVDSSNGTVVARTDYFDYDLDAERKVRSKIEDWHFFRVAEKPSEADFVLLVNLDDSSIEGLALPFDAYRQHFKEKFDLDALREAAYGRYVAGPLNLPTLSRLSDRLVKQFREQVSSGGGASRR